MRDIKVLVGNFLQKGCYPPSHQGKSFAKELAMQLLDKHKLSDQLKPSQKDFVPSFRALDSELGVLIKKIPNCGDWEGYHQTVIHTLESLSEVLMPRFQAKVLQELDTYFDSLASCFKSWAQTPSKPSLYEMISLSEVLWEWCEASELDASSGKWIPPSKTQKLRHALLHQLGSLDDPSSSLAGWKPKPVLEGVTVRKFWSSSRPSRWTQTNGSASTTKLGQVVAVERLLLGFLRTLAVSTFEKFGLDIGLETKVTSIYKKSVRFVESFVSDL